MIFCFLLSFFIINIFKKFFQEYHLCETVWNQIMPEVFSSLIWVQTVYKAYQQWTKACKGLWLQITAVHWWITGLSFSTYFLATESLIHPGWIPTSNVIWGSQNVFKSIHFVVSDLGPNFFQRLPADSPSR